VGKNLHKNLDLKHIYFFKYYKVNNSCLYKYNIICCAMFSCCSYYVISYEKSIMGSENTYASCLSRIMYVKTFIKLIIYNIIYRNKPNKFNRLWAQEQC
jgi:hypothetical protein